ncbi:MAG: CsbD family protein [Planctomycetota bacterium]
MDTQTIETRWNDLKHKVKQQWNKLTDNDLDAIRGNAERAKERIAAAYGVTKEKAAEQWREFCKAC